MCAFAHFLLTYLDGFRISEFVIVSTYFIYFFTFIPYINPSLSALFLKNKSNVDRHSQDLKITKK